MKRFEQYSDKLARLYPELHGIDENGEKKLTQTVTFQVTDNCNLACTYCYQIHKGKRRMSFETAKKFIDLLLFGKKGMSGYINPVRSPGLVVDFIGGEPFLEIELIDQICTYLIDKMIELNHPWLERTMFSIIWGARLPSHPGILASCTKQSNTSRNWDMKKSMPTVCTRRGGKPPTQQFFMTN